MARETSIVDDALRTWAREVDAGPHPSPAELIAYAERRTPEADKARMRSHLVLCQSCADAVLDLTNPERIPLPEPPLALSDDERAADLAAILARVDAQAEATASQAARVLAMVPPERPAAAAPRLAPRAALAAAACLALGFLLGFWWRPVPAGGAVRIEASPVEEAGLRTAGLAAAPTTRAAKVDEVRVIVLRVPEPAKFPLWAVELRRQGETIERFEALRVAADGTLTLSLPSNLLPAGVPVDFVLSGVATSASPSFVARYQVVIEKLP